MRHAFLAISLLPLLVAACGVGVSQSRGGGGTDILDDGGWEPDSPPAIDAGHDANTCSSVPGIQCADCEGNFVSGECVNGVYECPTYNCPIHPPDAGCNGEGVACPAFCGVVCENNQWTCICDEDGGPPPDARVFDVGVFDVGVPDVVILEDGNVPDATSGFFACGDQFCNGATAYCQVTTGGAAIDGSVATGYECIPLPNTCAPDSASCACVQAVQGIGCDCAASGGDVTITCYVP